MRPLVVIKKNPIYPLGHKIHHYTFMTDDTEREWVYNTETKDYIQRKEVEYMGSVSDYMKGGSTPSQYRKSVTLPLTHDRDEYVTVDVETMDIISAYGLNWNLANIQKAIHRLGKKDGVDEEYDYNKILFFTLRDMVDKGLITFAEFWDSVRHLGIGE